MSFSDHALTGCTSRPLASYLKAVGVLRLVAEQADPSARGYWKNDSFHLVTALDRPGLERFFLEEWQPAAFVSPWNKASGFFDSKDKGLVPVERSIAPRFAALRDGIAAAREVTAAMDGAVQAEKAIKDESNQIKGKAEREAFRASAEYKRKLAQAGRACKRLKDELQPECQRRWRGSALRWLRAALVIGGEGKANFPALLGTGGNDGKLDFTNNAYQRLGDLFDLTSSAGTPRPKAAELLAAALFAEPVTGQVRGGIGQYAPASAGGPNATSGPLAESQLNPWDLLLLLEGSLLFTAGATRRLLRRGAPQAAAPFAVRGQATGFGSASLADEGSRGEQWMPLWERPWSLGELSAVLTEGRCQLGAASSENALDVARSISRLGVARGITSFERYGYLERNGKSNYAVPLGRWLVKPEPHAALLDDLDAAAWWERIRRVARDARAPASFTRAERALAEAALAALAHGADPARWTAVLLALADIETQMTASSAFTAKQRLAPIPLLSPNWLRAVDDGRPELRLALCLAGAGAGHDKSGRPVDSVRGHWLPLKPGDRRFEVRESALAKQPRVVVAARNPEADLLNLVQRRLLEARAGGGRYLPLKPRPGTGASPADLLEMLGGRVDLDRVLRLARALSALDWPNVYHACLPAHPVSGAELEPAYLALRLAYLPQRLGDLSIPVDPEPLRLLGAGHATRAFDIVFRRLRGSGVHAPIRAVALEPTRARLYAASLAFAVDASTAWSFVRLLDPATTEELRHVG
jgi:CRISPR-associated protein Csx17